MALIVDFTKINLSHLPQVGGKNASLGEMITNLSALGIKVPRGFATVAEAYRDFLKQNNLENKIYTPLENLDIENVTKLKEISTTIQQCILSAKFSAAFEKEIETAYQNLKLAPEQTVAVRSSATAEDFPEAPFS